MTWCQSAKYTALLSVLHTNQHDIACWGMRMKQHALDLRTILNAEVFSFEAQALPPGKCFGKSCKRLKTGLEFGQWSMKVTCQV